MTSAEKLRGRERLPVVAILVLVTLMALAGGVLAASAGPSSPCSQANCVFVFDEGRFKTSEFPFPADPEDSHVGMSHRGLIVGGHIDAAGSHAIDFPAAPVTGATDIDHGQIVGFSAEEGRSAWLW